MGLGSIYFVFILGGLSGRIKCSFKESLGYVVYFFLGELGDE